MRFQATRRPHSIQRIALALVLAAGGATVGDSTAAEAPPSAPAAGPGFARAPITLNEGQRQVIGLTFGTVERRSITKKIRTVGRVDFDERKVVDVNLKVGGWIRELFVDFTGKEVRKGDPLFTMYSPEIVSTEQEYLLALRGVKSLAGSQVPGAAEAAASLLRVSRERLRLWDFTAAQIRELERGGTPKLDHTIYSPATGFVVAKTAVRGHRVEPGMTLYTIADLSTVWVYADIYEHELPLVRVGQEAKLTLSYTPDARFTARLTYLYPELDAKTRTVKARFELANTKDRRLRPQMYAQVELETSLGERLAVPSRAVLDSGRTQTVFVDGGGGRLIPREVRVGVRTEDSVEVIEGLAAGERIVTSGNFLVDSETKLQGADSMMGMMGAIGMGDWKMESAKPMEMGGESTAPAAAATKPAPPSAEEKQLGDLSVAVFPAKETAIVGENEIRIRVRDAGGKPVPGASVRLEYTMDMPGMTIESSHAKELGDGFYAAIVRFTMAGPWGLVLEARLPGKPPVRGKFTVRVAG